MIESEDQTGRKVILNDYPSAIVSVVPSQTELLFDLGLEDKIAGVTKFCVHPAKALNTKTIVVGEVVEIQKGMPHQLTALSDNSIVFEVSTEHFDDDSYRIYKDSPNDLK